MFTGDRQLRKHCPPKDCSTSSCGPLTPDYLAMEMSKCDWTMEEHWCGAFFVRGQRGWRARLAQRCTVPCLRANTQQLWETQSLPEKERTTFCGLAKTEDHHPNWAKRGASHMNYFFVLFLFVLKLCLRERLVRNFTPSWGIKPERKSSDWPRIAMVSFNNCI